MRFSGGVLGSPLAARLSALRSAVALVAAEGVDLPKPKKEVFFEVEAVRRFRSSARLASAQSLSFARADCVRAWTEGGAALAAGRDAQSCCSWCRCERQ